MRAPLSIVISGVLAGCAATPHADTTAPLSRVYDVDAQTMVSIVYDATRAQNYRVAVVDPEHGRARFVMMPRAGGAPLVVHLAAYGARRDRFETCVGACATTIAVTAVGGEDDRARMLLDAISVRAGQARLDP
jgi:hypothetical protein